MGTAESAFRQFGPGWARPARRKVDAVGLVVQRRRRGILGHRLYFRISRASEAAAGAVAAAESLFLWASGSLGRSLAAGRTGPPGPDLAGERCRVLCLCSPPTAGSSVGGYELLTRDSVLETRRRCVNFAGGKKDSLKNRAGLKAGRVTPACGRLV